MSVRLLHYNLDSRLLLAVRNCNDVHTLRQVLACEAAAGEVVNASEDIPKSFVVCRSGNKKILYLSQMASATLLKRAESGLL